MKAGDTSSLDIGSLNVTKEADGILLAELQLIQEILTSVSISGLPIVRTCLTAFVCASDYDDRTQFYMFEQEKTNMYKNSIQRKSWTFGSPAGQKI